MSPLTAVDARRHLHQDSNENRRTWGDPLLYKNNDNIRIMFQNINGFGYKKDDEAKTKGFFDLIKSSDSDIFTMAETNTDWRRVKKTKTIWEQTKSWFENVAVVVSHNQHDRPSTPYQPGGTAILHQGDVSLSIMEVGYDPKRLGRWTWSLIRGKNNVRLRVVSIYFASKPQEYGDRKAYWQQKTALLAMDITEDPTVCFWQDFWAEVDKWLDNGEQLVLCGDWNTDIRNESFLDQFAERNLIPAITNKHGKDTAPETYNAGSKPIDEIFVSSTLSVTAGGYLEHGTTQGDHRPLWIDLHKESALGTKYPDLPSHKARRLKCQVPRIVKRYLKALHGFYQKHNVYQRANKLFRTFQNPLTQAQRIEYEQLDQLRVKGMEMAEKKCRKLKMGQRKWSPLFAEARKKINYIKASISKVNGKKVNTKYLYRLSKQLGFSTEGISLEQLTQYIYLAKKEYESIKENHEEHRRTFFEDLATALSEEGNGSKESQLKQLILREEQQSTFRRIKRLKGNNNLATTFVQVHQDGEVVDIVDQTAMEQAIIESNRHKYHQCEQTCSFLQEPLVNDFGYHGEGPQMSKFFDGTYNIPADLDEYTKDYLRVCMDNKSERNRMRRSPQEYKESWEKCERKRQVEPCISATLKLLAHTISFCL